MINIIVLKGKKYEKILNKIKNPPQKLYAKGNVNLLGEKCIAVVGTRHCTDYGIQITKQFVEKLVKFNFCIVSGLAAGIDSVAHMAALKNNGKTIAVLPCGFNNIFPKCNQKLSQDIIEKGGLLISEYPEHILVDKNKFPERNRIVSGISLGTLVIEAAYRSGTSITARITLGQNKKVFCIPNMIGSKYGVGTNKLIKQGANLVTSAEDIIKEYTNISEKIEQDEEEEDIIYDEYERKKIIEEYYKLYDFLSYDPQNINEISKKIGKCIEETIYILTIMEIEGVVKKLPGNNYIRN